MRKDCPKCRGKGSTVVDYKKCNNCNGTGYVDSFEVENHFKGINNNAKAKFDLEFDQDIPCEICNGKGKIEIFKDCHYCKGTGQINVCKNCGKPLDSKFEYCRDCHIKIKSDNMKKQSHKNKKEEVFVLDPLCKIQDIKKDNLYKGKITRIEKYGVFISLNNNVWGLMRGNTSNYKVNDEIIARVTSIKKRENKIDMAPARVKNYEIKKLTRTMNRTKIEDLKNKMGRFVRIDGEVLQVQQTSGPTIFTITDETDVVMVAAFDEAGVRAYPDIDVGDVIKVLGEVNEHSGKIQIENQSLAKLDDNNKQEFYELIEKALDERSEPEEVDFLIKSDVLNRLKPKMREAAKKIKRAILDGRSILIRHHADADGICAGVAMEKALIPLIEDLNPNNDAQYYYFKRSPSKAPFYEIEDVVKDLSYALEDQERHGQKLPLIVLLDNGSTQEDITALMQAKIYDIEVVVIDHHFPGELLTQKEFNGEIIDGTVEVDEYVDTHVNPYLVGGDSQLTAGALSAEVAHIINPEVKDLIKHLPAIAGLGDHAECGELYQYLELAQEKGFSKQHLEKIAECVDFEAYFLRFMNGRGIMDTILAVDNIDKHDKMIEALYKEYKNRVNIQLEAALPNIKQKEFNNGIHLNIMDVEKFAHKFTFPAPGKTCGFVHDKVVKELGEDTPIITLGHGPDFGVIRATDVVNEKFGFNINNLITDLAKDIPSAGIDGGGHECAGSVKYIEGLGDEVLADFIGKIENMQPI